MKTQKKEEHCQRGWSIKLMIDGQQASQACSQMCKGKRIQSILVFFSFNLLMFVVFFLFTLYCMSSLKYLVEHLHVQILVLKKEKDGLPNYK
jgi:hypothetical protein